MSEPSPSLAFAKKMMPSVEWRHESDGLGRDLAVSASRGIRPLVMVLPDGAISTGIIDRDIVIHAPMLDPGSSPAEAADALAELALQVKSSAELHAEEARKFSWMCRSGPHFADAADFGEQLVDVPWLPSDRVGWHAMAILGDAKFFVRRVGRSATLMIHTLWESKGMEFDLELDAMEDIRHEISDATADLAEDYEAQARLLRGI